MREAILIEGCFLSIAVLFAGWAINNGLRAIAAALKPDNITFSTKGAGDE